MDRFFPAFIKYFFIVVGFAIISFFLVASYRYYNNHFNTVVTIKFTDLEPVSKNLPVYYMGYKIGKMKKIRLGKDFKSSLVEIVLYPNNLILPDNTIAKVKKVKDKDDNKEKYIELIYPSEPSKHLLKSGSTIEGHTVMDLDAFIGAISESGKLDEIGDNASTALANFGDTALAISDFFNQLNELVEENRPNIKKTTKSTADSAENVNKLTSQVQKSMNEQKLSNSVSNIEQSTQNIQCAAKNVQNITENVDRATKNLNKTMDKVDCTVSEACAATTNAKCITNGVSRLLNKRFAGFRIMFGKPVDKDCSCGCACPCKKR